MKFFKNKFVTLIISGIILYIFHERIYQNPSSYCMIQDIIMIWILFKLEKIEKKLFGKIE